MAKSKADRRGTTAASQGYFAWSRDPAVGLFAVLPLWLLYEGLRLLLTPAERNGAEVLLLQALHRLGPIGLNVLRVLLLVAVALAARSLVRRHIPWVRVCFVVALEGTVYGLLLGPLASAMATEFQRVLAAGMVQDRLVANLVGSLGAGIFEELVFRLGLMSALVWLWLRLLGDSKVPRWVGGAVAALLSALVFSWFHHVCGDPYTLAKFLFRTAAGLLLGLLFWARGFGVCVYTHAFYDVIHYLTR